MEFENIYSGDKYIDNLWHNKSDFINPKNKFRSCVLYFLQKESMSLDKLYTLLYLANKYHLRHYARMIWNDVWIAKKEGPRPFYGELIIQEMIDKKEIKIIK